jgi:hypothetical protein
MNMANLKSFLAAGLMSGVLGFAALGSGVGVANADHGHGGDGPFVPFVPFIPRPVFVVPVPQVPIFDVDDEFEFEDGFHD